MALFAASRLLGLVPQGVNTLGSHCTAGRAGSEPLLMRQVTFTMHGAFPAARRGCTSFSQPERAICAATVLPALPGHRHREPCAILGSKPCRCCRSTRRSRGRRLHSGTPSGLHGSREQVKLEPLSKRHVQSCCAAGHAISVDASAHRENVLDNELQSCSPSGPGAQRK